VRLATLGLSHETNTFARLPATYERFAEDGILRGEDIVRAYRESHATLAGFLEAGTWPSVEVVPLLFTQTNPIGTMTAGAFERIVGEMLDLLQDRGPWDGVLLALHGAAVSEQYPDADGEIAKRVRTLVAPDVPVGLAIDMHANISRQMV
jgi:microcystin degradation protein MlrC